MPAFVQGGPFKVQIELLLNEFKIYVNGNVSKTVKSERIFILHKYLLSMDFIYISIPHLIDIIFTLQIYKNLFLRTLESHSHTERDSPLVISNSCTMLEEVTV